MQLKEVIDLKMHVHLPSLLESLLQYWSDAGFLNYCALKLKDRVKIARLKFLKKVKYANLVLNLGLDCYCQMVIRNKAVDIN